MDSNFPQPADLGVIAWTYPPLLATNNIALTAGTVYAARVPLPAYPVTVSNITIGVYTQGSGLTSGENLVALYDNSLSLQAVSADQSAAWASGGMKTAAIGPVVLNVPECYVAVLANGTTPPNLVRAGGPGIGPSVLIRGAAFPLVPVFAHSSTGQTAMPSRLSPNTAAGISFYADLS
jgi:hypothetical protein